MRHIAIQTAVVTKFRSCTVLVPRTCRLDWQPPPFTRSGEAFDRRTISMSDDHFEAFTQLCPPGDEEGTQTVRPSGEYL